MLTVLTELLDDEASGSEIEFYETSALALARAGWSRLAFPGADGLEAHPIGTRNLNTLAKQITQFLLAGIETRVHETS